MLNALWIGMMVAAVACGALRGQLDAVAAASMTAASDAVTLALGLVGAMCFWLGLTRVLHHAGLMGAIARGLRPLMARLFPEVPPEHPAMSLMILNMTCNILGIGNAATPFGLKAMRELDRLNPHPGKASDAMALFLAINTSGLAVLPTGMVALRASLGSKAPGAIVVTTLLGTASATLVAILAAKLGARSAYFRSVPVAAGVAGLEPNAESAEAAGDDGPAAEFGAERRRPTALCRRAGWASLALLAGCFVYALCLQAARDGWVVAGKSAMGSWSLLLIMMGIVLFGLIRGVSVYDAVVEGGREGFAVAQKIIPYLVAIMVAVGMLRASGGIDLMVAGLAPFTEWFGMPPEALPMALLRPLTGSGSYAVAADTMKAHGPDSLIGQIVSTLMGTTETTFYVLALYFGVVGVRQARHTVLACLAADLAGTLIAVWSCRLLLH